MRRSRANRGPRRTCIRAPRLDAPLLSARLIQRRSHVTGAMGAGDGERRVVTEEAKRQVRSEMPPTHTPNLATPRQCNWEY
jgi:hypothetical protein